MFLIPISINSRLKRGVEMFVCICNAVSDEDIREEVALGATSLNCLRNRLGVAGQCGGCANHAEETLQALMSENGGRNVFRNDRTGNAHIAGR
jgi:bacterioferritin-associated ferredoxin